MDIYISNKTENGWGEPVRLPFPINTDNADEPEISVSGSGSLFFSSNRAGGYGDVDIYSAKLINGTYKVDNIGPGINTSSADECPAIAYDESFLVFDSWRNGYNGLNELFVSFKKKDGSWTYPKILGPAVNTNQLDIYPNITPDGKYLLFTRREASRPSSDGSRPSSLFSKLYWVSIQLIDSLKKTDFEPYCRNSIPNLNAIVGVHFNYQIPDSIFADDDENDTLSYSASNMPTWLNFDAKTKIFSGTPTSNLTARNITVTATDLSHSSVVSKFTISIQEPNDVKNGHSSIDEFKLDQNYPNPFNPTTMISYKLPVISHVKLKIFDLLGKEIKILVNENQNCGKHEIKFDGNLLPSGTYFVKLQTDYYAETKKMILLK
jgi:hypothetical protein